MADAFVKHTRRLLKLEFAEETAAAQHDLDVASASHLQSKGVTLLGLSIASSALGLYGRLLVVFERQQSKPLPSHNFSCGTIVRVVSQQSPTERCLINGVVTKFSDTSVSVAFADDADEERLQTLRSLSPLRLDILPNDASHRKVLRALDELAQVRSSDAVARVVGVLFNGDMPSRVESGPGSSNFAPLNTEMNGQQIEAVRFALASRDVALVHGPPGTGKTTVVVELIRQAVLRNERVLVCAPSNVAVDNIVARLASVRSDRGGKMAVPKLVRVGHPARMNSAVLQHSLDACIQRASGTEVVREVRRELCEVLRRLGWGGHRFDAAKGGRRAAKESAIPSHAGRRELRAEVKRLRRELRRREEGVVRGILSSCDVVLCTVVGAAEVRRLLSRKGNGDNARGAALFDLVLIDEAAQATEASCWVPMLLGARVCLAGDHRQLPPTIKSEEAARDGLSETLFARVMALEDAENEPAREFARMLTRQYRMNATIMEWASKEMYAGRLEAAPSVAHHVLAELPHIAESLKDLNDDQLDECSAKPIPHLHAAMVLVDTAGCGLHEDEAAMNHSGAITSGDVLLSKSNSGEASLVESYVRALLDSGVRESEVAVITPYNAQVSLLRALLCQFTSLEIRSVDGFQGREKEVVILSLVRSNNMRRIGFLADERRLNVAVTRARRQVCIVCDTDTISGCRSSFLKRMIDYFESHGEYVSARDISTNSSVKVENAVAVEVTTRASAEQNKVDSKRRESIRAKIQNYFFGSNSTGHAVLSLPAELTSAERRVAHEIAEEFCLDHLSEGDGSHRHIVIRRKPCPDVTSDGQSTTQAPLQVPKHVLHNNRKETTDGALELGNEPTGESRQDLSGPDEHGSRTNSKGFASLEFEDDGSQSAFDELSHDFGRKGFSLLASEDDDEDGDEPSSHISASELSHPTETTEDAPTRVAKAGNVSESESTEVHLPVNSASKAVGKRAGNRKKRNRQRRKKGRVPANSSNAASSRNVADGSSGIGVSNIAHANDDDFALLDAIISECSRCAFRGGCKTSVKVISFTCKLCRREFCAKHQQPEVHGCAAEARAQARKSNSAGSRPGRSDTKTCQGDLRRSLRNKLSSAQGLRKAKTKKSKN